MLYSMVYATHNITIFEIMVDYISLFQVILSQTITIPYQTNDHYLVHRLIELTAMNTLCATTPNDNSVIVMITMYYNDIDDM